jgi:transposase
MTHDYKRNGTTTLFAALNVLDGKVIGECHSRHRHQEWLKFLRRLDAGFPPQLKLHLVMDNYGTHKEPHLQAWLKKHPRFVCHYVPTSSSWLNLVERWFRELTEKAIRRGSFVCAGSQAGDRGIYASLEPKPQAVHLERHRRGHPQRDRSRAGQDGADQTRIHPAQGEKEDS